MDPTTVAIILAYAEIKSVCELLVKHPDNETERIIGEHILKIMQRHLDERESQ